MSKKINMGIGFVTGRPNVCKIINSYYSEILNQVKDKKDQINLIFLFYLT